MISTELFGPNDRVAVIAGSGRLPVEVADGLARQGKNPLVLMVDGEVNEPAALAIYEHRALPIEEFGRLPALIKEFGITHIVMAGGIARRPSLWRIRPTLAILANIPRIVRALSSGDNRLLSLLVRSLERYGVKVVGAHEVVPDLLAPAGVLTGKAPLASDQRDIQAAWRAAKAIGALDIGQAAIAIGGRAVALEGIEGTTGLLERTRSLRSHGRLAGKQRGVLVKCAKPDQEVRADLPAIGPETVDAAHAAGLAGIGVEAGHALILDAAETIARADRVGLFITGLGPEGQ